MTRRLWWIGMMLAGIVRLSAQDAMPVEVYTITNDDGTIDAYADNDHIIPVYVVVDAPRRRNVTPSVDLPHGWLLQPGERDRLLFSVSPTNPSAGYSFSIRSIVARGDPLTTKPDADYLYLFPFAHGSKHRITQGYNGRATHFGENRYALDFDLEIGTAVYAARDGLVAEVKEDSRSGGASPTYSDDGNFVLIWHNDGTFANYVHLQFDGALVETGDRVRAGQLIGYSGNTGRSSGPHLHFDVRVPTTDGVMQSIPVRFLDHRGMAIEPQEDAFYYARHPDGPPFDPSFGADLIGADFADYAVTVPFNDMLDFRIEQIDLTIAAYFSNGRTMPIDIDVTYRLIGVRADSDNPHRLTIPAGTEIFAGLFRVIPSSRRISISPNIRIQQ